MTLYEFLRKKTQALELCVVRENGWIAATYFIDYEDLFCRHLSKRLGDMEVKNDEWSVIDIKCRDGKIIQTPCHYIDV